MTISPRLLAAPFRDRLRAAGPLEVAAAPLAAAAFVDDEQQAAAAAAGVSTLGELALAGSEPWIGTLGIDPVRLDLLICALLYPQHDPGPDCGWERLFHQAPLDHYVQLPGAPFHTRFGPVFYRGRLDGTARVLVVGQDPSTDETLAGRVLVGRAGQRTQHLLGRLGLTRSYLMLNAFLFGGQSNGLTPQLTTDLVITGYRNRLFDRARSTSPITAVLTFGTHAKDAIAAWPGKGTIPVVEFVHPTAQAGVAASWNAGFTAAHAALTPDPDGTVDLTPYPDDTIPTRDIPRRDLPFGCPAWHGTGGDTDSRRGAAPSKEIQIVWTAP